MENNYHYEAYFLNDAVLKLLKRYNNTMCNIYISILIYHLPITQQKYNAPSSVTNSNLHVQTKRRKWAFPSLLPPDWVVPREHIPPEEGSSTHRVQPASRRRREWTWSVKVSDVRENHPLQGAWSGSSPSGAAAPSQLRLHPHACTHRGPHPALGPLVLPALWCEFSPGDVSDVPTSLMKKQVPSCQVHRRFPTPTAPPGQAALHLRLPRSSKRFFMPWAWGSPCLSLAS